MRSFDWLLFVTILATLSGCGGGPSDAPDRVTVAGSVSFDGEPVSEGEIRFVPDDSTLPLAAAQIRDGRYEVTNKGGVPVGDHRVEIRGFRPKPGAAPLGAGVGPDEGTLPTEQYLPAKYNDQTELKLTVEEGGPVQKDFSLEP